MRIDWNLPPFRAGFLGGLDKFIGPGATSAVKEPATVHSVHSGCAYCRVCQSCRVGVVLGTIRSSGSVNHRYAVA